MRADVAIITTHAAEFQAVLKYFIPYKPRKGFSGRTYGICQVKTRNERESTVALVQCSEDGSDASQQVTNDVIRDWDPHILLVVGIAGGVPHNKFTLGDVIISSRIHNLNVSALHANKLSEFDIRGGTHPLISDIVASLPLYTHLLDDWNKGEFMGLFRPAISPTLSSVLPDIGSIWQERISSSLDWHFGKAENRSRAPIFLTGTIASSNTLIRDPHPLIQWLQSARSILAVEMEAAGVYQAAQQMHKQYPVMAVRGISDIIGLERDPQWVIYACEAAASFAYAFVTAGIIDADTSLTITDEARRGAVTAPLSSADDATSAPAEAPVQMEETTPQKTPSTKRVGGPIQVFYSRLSILLGETLGKFVRLLSKVSTDISHSPPTFPLTSGDPYSPRVESSPDEDLQSRGRSIGGPSGTAGASAIEGTNINQRLPRGASLDHLSSLTRLKTAFQRVDRGKRRLTLICCALLIVLMAGLLSYNFFVYQPNANSTCNPVGIFQIGSVLFPPTLRAVRAPDSQCVGVSNGNFAFDLKRTDAQVKSEAAEAFRGGNTTQASSKWKEALQTDTNDAEAGIYLQDQQVINSGQPYITFIVVATLTGDDLAVSAGRDTLQGAYVAQKEYNAAAQAGDNNLPHLPNQVQVVLLVANVSWASPDKCPDTCTNSVVSQIIQAANIDHHIKGIIGWPSVSSPTLIQKLASAGLAIISTTSSDWSGVSSPYFFHVAPTLQDQTGAAATYATTSLHVKTAALFFDPDTSYSSTLAYDFKQHFEQAGGSIIYAGLYTVNHAGGSRDYLHAALQVTPDLIYFAGYANDISQFITNLQGLSESPPLVMGADALYSPGGYTPGALNGFNRLYFTASAYPDERSSSNPTFFADYAQDFDPDGKHQGNPYGYIRPDGNVMLSYDATLAFLYASSQLLTGDKNDFTTQALQQAISQVQNLQGITGLITFASASPKAVVVLRIQDEKNMFADSDQWNSIIGGFSCSSHVEVGISCPSS